MTQGLVVSWVIDPLVVGNRPRALDRVENQYASENPEPVRQATASQNLSYDSEKLAKTLEVFSEIGYSPDGK